MGTSDDKPLVDPASPGDPDPRDLIGSTIDQRYRILELLGQGGMGNVYKAEHVTIRRTVALKLLHPALATLGPIRKRFEREAFAIGRIDHPNCVHVTDFGKLEDGSLYLAMEYLEGESLGDRLDRHRFVAPRRALHIARHLLRGLGHVHRAGIVHRDVKPENVFLIHHEEDTDFAKILDFGIAKVIGGDDSDEVGDKLTQAGVAFGTPIYLSPEQAVGDPAGPQSDLYSTTVMLFEMIAGQPPFWSDDKLQILAMHTTRPPPRLGEFAGEIEIPDGLEELIERGLAKRPADRYVDADEYIADIDRIVEPFSENTPPLMRLGSSSDARIRIGGPTPLPLSQLSTPAPRRISTPGPGFHWGSPSAAHGASTPGTLHRIATPVPIMAAPQAHHAPPFAEEAGPPVNLRRPMPRALILLVALAISAAVAWTMTRGKDGERAQPTASPPKNVAHQVEKAEAELAEGDPARSIEYLESKPGVADNPAAQLQLGHAYSTQLEYGKALAAYTRAVELDRLLGDDPKMQANLRLMIDDDGPRFAHAARLLIEHAADPAAKRALLAIAASKDRKERRDAFRILERLGFDGEIDRVKAFSWDLQQGETCAERKAAVAKLRALGNPRAVPALQQTLARKLRRANRCMLQHAQDAIRYLESLPGAGTGAPDAPTPD